MKKSGIFLLLIIILNCSNYTTISQEGNNEPQSKKDYSHLLEDKGDYYILGGDMILYKGEPYTEDLVAELEGSELESRGLMLTTDSTWTKWGKGVVKYAFISLTEDQKAAVKKSIKILESVCGVKYQDVTGVSNYDYIYKVSMSGSSIGSSTLGQSKYASVSLGGTSISHILHEFMHGLGMKHEHQRWDARTYINFYEDRLNGSIGVSQYDTYPKSICKTYGSYDYASIMHYRSNTGGTNVLVAKNGSTLSGDYLTTGDKLTLRELYGISRKSVKTLSGNFIKVGHDREEEVILIYGDKLTMQGKGSTPIMRYVSGDQILKYSNWREKTWRFNFETDKYFSGDFDGNGKDDILAISDWGLGVITGYGNSSLRTIAFSKSGTRFGGWYFNSKTDEIVAIDDFNGDGNDEILIRSPWGIGILDFNGTTFSSIVCKPFSSNFGGWRFGSDHNFVSYGNYDNDSNGQVDILVESSWGIGILTYDGASSLTCKMGKPYGTWFNHWSYYKGQQFIGSGNLDGISGDEILVKSDWGIGILKLTFGSTLTSIMCKPYNQLPDELKAVYYITELKPASGGYGFLNEVKYIEDFNKDGRDEILMNHIFFQNSPVGFSDDLFRFNGSTLVKISSGSLKSNGYYPFDRTLDVFDYDKDGRLDFVTYQTYPYPEIFIFEYEGNRFNKLNTIY